MMLGLFSFELYVGTKEMCEQIADKLKANSIEYKMKSDGQQRRNSFTPINSSYGALGVRNDSYRQNESKKDICHLYVKKEDKDQSIAIMNTR